MHWMEAGWTRIQWGKNKWCEAMSITVGFPAWGAWESQCMKLWRWSLSCRRESKMMEKPEHGTLSVGYSPRERHACCKLQGGWGRAAKVYQNSLYVTTAPNSGQSREWQHLFALLCFVLALIHPFLATTLSLPFRMGMCTLYQRILELHNFFFDFTGSHSNEFILILKRNFGLLNNVGMGKTLKFLKVGLKAIWIGDGHEPLESEMDRYRVNPKCPLKPHALIPY